MKASLRMFLQILATAIVCCGLSRGQVNSKPGVQEMLKWFPADTDTIIVANGPFPLPDLQKPEGQAEHPPQDAVPSYEQLQREFEIKAITLWAQNNTVIAQRLRGERVLLAVQGYRYPEPERLVERCAVIVFEGGALYKLIDASAEPPLMTEEIDGLEVFTDKSEDGARTLAVTQPRPDVLIISESFSFLKEVQARMNGEQGDRALPDTLPEWRHVDTSATFWGVRRFPRWNAKPNQQPGDDDDDEDEFPANLSAVTFSFGMHDDRAGIMTFIPTDEKGRNYLWQAFQEDHGKSHVESKKVEPDAIQASFFLVNQKTFDSFSELIESLFGEEDAD